MKPFSATEIDTARGCLRKWGWRYVAGIKAPPHPSAVKGSALHRIAEAYLRDGTQPDRMDPIADLFLEGLPHLPPPRTGAVEASFTATIGGFYFHGVVDWFGPSDVLPGAPGGRLAVLDHKTSKDPRRYGLLSKPQHLNNPQSLIYAEAGRNGGAALLRWVYYHTGGKPKATAVTVELKPADVEAGLDGIVLPIAEKLYRIRESGLRDVLELPPNPAECDAYGGCPYRDRCGLQPRDYLGVMFGGPMSNPFAVNAAPAGVNPFAVNAAPAAAASAPTPGVNPFAVNAPPAPTPAAGSLMAKLPPPPSAVAPSVAAPTPASTGPAVVVKGADEKILAAFRAAAHAFLTALS